MHIYIYIGQIWLQEEAYLFQELVCPQYFTATDLKNISNSSTPSLMLYGRVCFGISHAHLDTADRNFTGHNSDITNTICSKESSGKCKHKH